MKTHKHTYSSWLLFSSLFMMVTLIWLTVSIPFVNAAQQKQMNEKTHAAHAGLDDEDQKNNPYGNNTEEKCPSSSSVTTLSEEYLHHSEDLFHAVEIFLSHHSAPAVAEYVAFHGELLSPPPNSKS